MEALFDFGGGGGGLWSPVDAMVIDLKSDYKTVRLWSAIWWKFMTGEVVILDWPLGPTEPDADGKSFDSNDPNDHWRPWLEANVGKQHIDWDWQVSNRRYEHASVEIRFRRGKRDLATQAKLRWG